jgi:small subunit ribosomal protein S20
LANLKSSKKDIVRSRKRRVRNLNTRSRLKTAVGKARTAITAGDPIVAAEMARQASRLLDKAASKGIVHKRQADRRKSRLARRFGKAFSGT